jgi:hypothetical protein
MYLVSILLLSINAIYAIQPRHVIAGVANFKGIRGVSGSIRFDGSCVHGVVQVTVNVFGLHQRYGAWKLHDGSTIFGCESVLTESYGYVKGHPIVPYGLISDRLGVLSNDDTIVRLMWWMDVELILALAYFAWMVIQLLIWPPLAIFLQILNMILIVYTIYIAVRLTTAIGAFSEIWFSLFVVPLCLL